MPRRGTCQVCRLSLWFALSINCLIAAMWIEVTFDLTEDTIFMNNVLTTIYEDVAPISKLVFRFQIAGSPDVVDMDRPTHRASGLSLSGLRYDPIVGSIPILQDDGSRHSSKVSSTQLCGGGDTVGEFGAGSTTSVRSRQVPRESSFEGRLPPEVSYLAVKYGGSSSTLVIYAPASREVGVSCRETPEGIWSTHRSGC